MTKQDFDKRLCIIKENVACFVSDYENVRGDDWNDEPYECNASWPYVAFEQLRVLFDEGVVFKGLVLGVKNTILLIPCESRKFHCLLY